MGTRRTLAIMAELANAAASDERFVSWCNLLPVGLSALDSWLRGHYRYRAEHDEVIRTVFFMVTDLQRLGHIEGDCDDISTFYAGVLKALGYRVRLVAIRFDSPEFQHVFVEAKTPMAAQFDLDGWIRLDPTVERSTVHQELERMVQDV